jgi:serine/threonine protein kinase
MLRNPVVNNPLSPVIKQKVGADAVTRRDEDLTSPANEQITRSTGFSGEIFGLSSVRPGSGLIGPYSLVREIGRGGYGIVYLADDTRLGR